MKNAPWLVAGALAVLLVLSQCAAGRAVDDRDARVDSLRSEEIAARADAMGWETRFSSTVPNLARALQEAQDSAGLLSEAKDSLAREVELLAGRLSVMADLYADLRGQIEAHDAVVHISDSTKVAPDSVTAYVDDGLLNGRIAFIPPDVLDLEYQVQLALTLGWIEVPDGRMLVTARAQHPNIALSYGDIFYAPPAPVEFCSLSTKLTWAAGGTAVGGLAQPLFDLIKSFINSGG